jgi:predicted nucleic acid-binding Zn ribbon protein
MGECEFTWKPSVVLRPAYAWDCEECGREAFTRAIVPEFSPEELVALRNEHQIEAEKEGDFLMMPEEVECPHCNARFNTVHFGDD